MLIITQNNFILIIGDANFYQSYHIHNFEPLLETMKCRGAVTKLNDVFKYFYFPKLMSVPVYIANHEINTVQCSCMNQIYHMRQERRIIITQTNIIVNYFQICQIYYFEP